MLISMEQNRTASLCTALLLSCTLLSGCQASWKTNHDSSSLPSLDSLQTQFDLEPQGIVIAEVMANNQTTWSDLNGNTPDYITLLNTENKPMSLAGFFLSDDEDEPEKWQFPDITMDAHAFLTIFADGSSKSIPALHTNFSVSSTGETIYLTAPNQPAQAVYVPAMPPDYAYGLVLTGSSAGQYEYFCSGTIFAKNDAQHSADLTAIFDGAPTALVLNEYMIENQDTILDENGASSDWIELYNPSDQTIALDGMTLTDEYDTPNKWVFPDGITLKPNDYLLLWMDGLDRCQNNEIHSGFRLSTQDDGIMLTDQNGLCVFRVDMPPLEKDLSYGLDAQQHYVFFGNPTPRQPNPDTGYPGTMLSLSFQEKTIYISEAAPLPCGKTKESFDWIELHNPTDQAIDLQGWGIGQNPLVPEYLFDSLSIPPQGYHLLYAAGDGKSGKSDAVYLPFKLSQQGDRLYLFNPQGECYDAFESGWILGGNTCGRTADHGTFGYFAAPTPCAANPEEQFTDYTPLPQISQQGGYAKSGDIITAQCESDVILRYTTDGSEPDPDDPVFESFTIGETNCILRWKAYKEGYLPSRTFSATYITEETHDIPFVALSCDPVDLFSNERGILAFGYHYDPVFPYVGANFWQDWGKMASFEYFTPDGSRQLDCNAEIKVFGQYSRAQAQKSLSIHFRGEYGNASVTYPFFEGNPQTEFSSLVLRAGGQDQQGTKLRDAFCAEITSEYSDLACMDWQPTALYLNGQYYGYYDLREKINEDYFESNENIDRDQITIIKGNSILLAGSLEEYNTLRQYVRSHDLSDPEVYAYVDSQIDIANYIDYLIAEIFFCNTDTGNIKFYRNADGGKWRWILFDMDTAMRKDFGLKGGFNSIREMFNPSGHGVDNMFYTTIQCGLLENEGFRTQFINRYAELLNTVFQPEHLTERFQQMASAIDAEVQLHAKRWNRPSYSTWQRNLTIMEEVCANRRDVAKAQFIAFFRLSAEQVAALFPNG